MSAVSVIASTLMGPVAAGGAPAFDYLTIPSLTLALDAAIGVVSGADGADAGSEPDVASWTDQTGSKVFTPDGGVPPNFRASDANANGQPSIVFDVADSRLVAPSASIALAWFAAVAWYPGTTFSNFDPIFASRSPLNAQVLRGNSGSADWRAADISGTRYRDGATTDTALTTASAVHLYEFVPTTPIAGTSARWEIGRESSSRYWRGGICLMLAASAVPDAPIRAALLAYCRSRFGVP